MFTQEPKLEKVKVSVHRGLWNLDDFDWIMQKSMGNSSGLLCIWNKKGFVKQSVLEGDGFIAISGEWDHEKL